MAQCLRRRISNQAVPGSIPSRCTFRCGLEQVTFTLLSTGWTQEAVEGRPTWTDCDEAGDYVVPYVLSPRDLVFRPDNMDETVPHNCTSCQQQPPYNNTYLSTILPEIRLYLPAYSNHHHKLGKPSF